MRRRYSAGRVSRRILAWFLSLLVVLLAFAGDAGAVSNDKEIETLIEGALESYAAGKHDDALTQLDLGKQACEAKQACSSKVRASLYVVIGTVLAGGKKKVDEAKQAFATALKEDPTAALLNDLITPEVQRAWNEARNAGSASGGTAETKARKPEERKPKKTFPGNLRAPRGWRTAEGYFYYNEAAQSEASRDWLDCADYAQASLAAENRAGTRFLAAACEERAGLWIEALSDYQIVADAAPKLGMRDVGKKASDRIQKLRERIPKVILRKPAKGDELVVKLNDAEIAPEKLNGEIWINPGQRTIVATAKVDGVPLEFEQVIDATEGQTVTVDIKLGPKGAKGDQVMMRCMLAAQTRDDFAKCLNKGGTLIPLNVRAGLEVSAYHDTNNVDVVTPAVFLAIESPTAGWGVGASFLVDVVTAASPDIVANASPRWREVRYAPALSGHKKFGDVDVSLRGSFSREPDYLSAAGGAGVSMDLRQKTITPSLTYEFSYDLSGRVGTPFSVFGRKITRHAVGASVTFVVNRSTIFATTFNAVIEDGDSSKPYRYLPMFDKDTAAAVPIGLAIDAVNKYRLAARPLEQLPLSRQRWALAGLLAHRFTSSTLRAEERLYVDSWGLKASTTDARYLIDATDRLRVWPHVRFHAQSAASFWKLAYVATPDPKGESAYRVPAIRTGDRELGPLIGVSGGGGVRYAFGEKKTWALSVAGDVLYTRFLDHLFLLDRIGYFGSTTLEVEFE
jgi:hypothetical protein